MCGTSPPKRPRTAPVTFSMFEAFVPRSCKTANLFDSARARRRRLRHAARFWARAAASRRRLGTAPKAAGDQRPVSPSAPSASRERVEIVDGSSRLRAIRADRTARRAARPSCWLFSRTSSRAEPANGLRTLASKSCLARRGSRGSVHRVGRARAVSLLPRCLLALRPLAENSSDSPATRRSLCCFALAVSSSSCRSATASASSFPSRPCDP